MLDFAPPELRIEVGALCSCGCAGQCKDVPASAPWGRCLFEDAAGHSYSCGKDAARQVWHSMQAFSRRCNTSQPES